MSKICRTCLERTDTTYKTSHELFNFGEASIRISVVLRFCIPELYLGLSPNPEICFTCMENLKVAYLFKRKCLETEGKIGNFLKNVRCTGKSVELHHVLAFINNGHIPPVLLKEVTLPCNAACSQNTSSESKDPPESVTMGNENLQVIDKQPSLLKPKLYKTRIVNSADPQNVIVNFVNNSFQNSPQTTNDITHTNLEDKDDTDSFCKITSVFSLNDCIKDASKNDLNNINFDGIAAVSKTKEEVVDIKDEPLDIDLTDNFKNIAQDEDTLDASETRFYDKESDSSLQDIISSIPEINHPDQYVDVPDFVTINNFGFKELEEFKLQQTGQTASEPAKEMSEVTINSDDLDKTDKTSDASISVNGSEMKVVKVLANAPDVIIFNGKRMVKCGSQYRLEEDLPKLEGSGKQAPVQEVETKGPLPSNRKRTRRKIKMVPVGEQPPEKSIKLESNPPVLPVKPPKTEDKDIVVLFTNYTNRGDYINDHDYLISPYKRNKVLIEEQSQWFCVCFICNTKHAVCEHVKHMNTHGPLCTICSSDLGTPFMLNLHCKAHKRPCRYCTEVVPQALLKSHEAKHAAEEKEIVHGSKRSPYHVRRGRKRYKEDEKPVYFPILKQGGKDLENGEGSQSETMSKTEIPDIGNEINPSVDTGTIKKRKGRPRRLIPSDIEIIDSPRALRTRVKKWYVESEDEDERSKEGTSGDKGAEVDPNTTKRQNWDIENMLKAVDAIRQKTMGYKAAARKFGVARSTLYRLSKSGKSVQKMLLGRRPALPAALENELVAYVRMMEVTYFGLTQQDVRRMAFQLARRNNVHHTFSLLHQAAGQNWMNGFLDRHRNILNVKKPKRLVKENVEKFFDLLEDAMEVNNYPPHRIYNVDVTGFYVVQTLGPRVVAAREKQQAHLMSSVAKDSSMSLVLCMSASGHFVPPMIVLPRKFPGEGFKKGAPRGSVLAYHPMGWIQADLFTEWFDHFLRHVNPTEDSPALLLINGQHTHARNLDFFLRASENFVTIICLPPYGTQEMQPLDQTVMTVLKNYYKEEVMRFTTKKNRAVTHFDVCELFGNAYSKIQSEETAIRGFREARIYPVARSVISDDVIAKAGKFNGEGQTKLETLKDGVYPEEKIPLSRLEILAPMPTKRELKTSILRQNVEVMKYDGVPGTSRVSKFRNELEKWGRSDSESDEFVDDCIPP